MRWQRTWGVGVVALAAAVAAAGMGGCIPRKTAPQRQSGQPVQAARPAPANQADGPKYTVSALPAFRLVADEFLLDLPSRLLVIQLYRARVALLQTIHAESASAIDCARYQTARRRCANRRGDFPGSTPV